MLSLFPRSSTALLQAATAQYNLRNYTEAQQLFEELVEADPDRIEGMDIYSNILYVQEAFGPLSALAHRMTQVGEGREDVYLSPPWPRIPLPLSSKISTFAYL